MEVKQPEILKEMNRLITAANEKSIQLRAIGGLAIQSHNKGSHPVFVREYPDLDFVVTKKQRREFEAFMQEMGFVPDKQFNLLNGSRRQIFYNKETDLRVDIFVGDFEMCHKLPLEDRLMHDPVTIPLAELLLSKMQIVELNHKDALDIISLLLNNELGRDDNKKINLRRIAQLCVRYWGLYKTTSINLKRVEEILLKEELGLSEEEHKIVLRRVYRIRRALKAVSKNIFWHIRDQVGARVRWYIEVEEVDR